MSNLKVFSSWNERSSVRNSPQRILTGSAEDKCYFSSRLSPLLRHHVTQRLGEADIRKVEVQLLFSYLRFTEHLETNWVNKVIVSIMNDNLPIKFSEEIKNEAYKIYCDEAYHALQSHDMIDQVIKISGYSPMDLPVVLSYRLELLKRQFEPNLLPLFDLLFVAVAETLVSQELRECTKDNTMHPAINDIMKDHARDEASHALFFKEILICLKQQLTANDFQYFVDFIPNFLEAYLLPERSNIEQILKLVLTESLINTVICDISKPRNVNAFTQNASTFLYKTIDQINAT